MEKFRIMFVCHGNICRSPMAEFIFRDIAQKNGKADRFIISSSATSTEEIICGRGNPVYPPAKEMLLSKGIVCDGKRAVQLKREDYENYDLFIGMDSANIRNMKAILGKDDDRKIRKLMSFAGRNSDVADPWYSGRFDIAYNDILEGCEGLWEELKKQKVL